MNVRRYVLIGLRRELFNRVPMTTGDEALNGTVLSSKYSGSDLSLAFLTLSFLFFSAFRKGQGTSAHKNTSKRYFP